MIPNRNEEINIPIFLCSLFLLYKYGFNAYEIYFIRYTKAKLALTWIDTSYKWCTIFNQIDSCKLGLVQNGRALKSRFNAFDKKENLSADYYFINGSYVKDFFSKRLSSNYIITGSIIGNYFKKCKIEKVDTVQWISQYRLHGSKSKIGFQKNFENLSIKILPVIKKFCEKNNLNLEIISNTGNNLEKKFYDNSLEDYNFVKIDKNKNPYGSYSNLKSNAIIVGVDSQFLYEVFSLGYRTAFFSSLGPLMSDSSRNFSWPNKVPDFGPFWANKFDSKKYSLILNNLMRADKIEILSYYETYSGVMFYDFSNTKIKNILKNEGI